MSKALIEKAFKKYCETTKLKVNPVCDRASRCELCKSSWLASATWQREQLIQELREWVNSNEGRIETDGKTWYKLVNGTDLLAKLDLLEGNK